MEQDNLAQQLAGFYGLSPQTSSLSKLGNGHINETWLLTDEQQSLVVQKLNVHVFPEPEHVIRNARQIEQHLMAKADKGAYALDVVKQFPTNWGDYLLELNGDYWRAMEHIPDSVSEDVVTSPEQAEAGARGFGLFAAALQDFDPRQLYPVIPDFHNLTMRLATFADTVDADPVGRVAECHDEIAFCRKQAHLADELNNLQHVPLRPCHNDTKINNLLFDTESHQAKAVIDLDTCMPGYWLYDFGDMVRTCCSPQAEDSTALDKVRVRPEIFQALVNGYVTPLAPFITKQELLSFLLGAKVMPFMIGLRFFTDYLDGDHYFSTRYPEHNLHRAQNQFALYRSVCEQEQRLRAMLESV